MLVFLSCKENMLPGTSPLERFRQVAEAGFAGIDLMGGSLKVHMEEVKTALAETGLIPAAVYGQLGGTGTSLIEQTAVQRVKSLDLFKQRLEATAEIGSRKLIFVPRFGTLTLRPEAAEWVLVTMLDELLDWVQDLPVTLVMEPLNRNESQFLYDPLIAMRIAQTVNHPKLQTMVDTYHMEVENQDMGKMIRAIHSYLAIVHLSDTNRRLPGQGNIDFRTVLRTLKEMNFEGPVGFECSNVVVSELKASVDHLEDIRNSL